ncbi:GIY-YIG nuclease family protein [Belliella marina]|uniref:GIY-YIG nuclease family protein n=1 Tax=Belliella marina TaxID=1644146 RepID=A0ABW4VNW2_9BACT
MYFLYILYFPKTDRYYIGSTDDLSSRLRHHNLGLTPSTKAGFPEWAMVLHEVLADRTAALKREREIKKKKSRKYIEWLIESQGSVGQIAPDAFGTPQFKNRTCLFFYK